MKKLLIPLSIESWLVRWANRMRGYYGHPIYLVGSQLSDNPNPNDVDVICILPDAEFKLRFCNIDDWMNEGGTYMYTEPVRWKWSDRCIKDTLDGMAHTRMNIDFKVIPHSDALAYENKPRLKLDTREDN